MKVMVFVKATADSENQMPPDAKLLQAMHEYNEAPKSSIDAVAEGDPSRGGRGDRA